MQLLRDKEAQAVERLFRLLALQHRGEDFKGIYRGLHAVETRAPGAAAASCSRTSSTPPLRGPVLAIVDEAPDAARLARAGELYVPADLGYEDVLGLILDRGGESLRCVAAHHVGRAGPRRAAAAPREAAREGRELLPRARRRARARRLPARPEGLARA